MKFPGFLGNENKDYELPFLYLKKLGYNFHYPWKLLSEWNDLSQYVICIGIRDDIKLFIWNFEKNFYLKNNIYLTNSQKHFISYVNRFYKKSHIKNK